MSYNSRQKVPPKILIASMMGNCLEQYDFMLYVFLAPFLAPVFFPTEDKLVSLILSMSVYAIGFIARPLGAIFFGKIGDISGRRKALSMSIFGMAFFTACMGFVPSYEQIGVLAPLLIILLRLLQSFCVAGEYNGAALFVLEHTPAHKENFISGVYVSSGALGTLLASLTLWFVLNYQVQWNSLWRVSFIFPAVFGLVGYYIRRSLTEDLFPQRDSVKEESLSLRQTFKEYPFELLLVFGIASFSGCLIYFLMAFPSAFIPQISSISLQQMSKISSIILFIYAFNLWFMGYISDLVGSWVMMVANTLLLLIFAPLFYSGLLSNNIFYISVSLLGLSFFVAAFLAPSHVLMKNLFPLRKRYTAISLAFNVGNGFLGATSSAIAMMLYKITGNPLSPLFYLIFCGSLFLSTWVVFLIKKGYILYDWGWNDDKKTDKILL